MTFETLAITASLLPAIILAWILPASLAMEGVAALAMIVLLLLSPLSALWLLTASVITPVAIAIGNRTGARNAVAIAWGGLLVAALFLSREWAGVFWIGGAYFTLRNLHVLLDWWMGRLENPGLARHLRYQFFLPAIPAGPIHRLQNFERQLERRRWSTADFLRGLERAVFGLAMFVVLGGKAASLLRAAVERETLQWQPFLQRWSVSVVDWIELYFSFAGLSALAIGVALMMGLVIEENFNRPWAARNLLDFWTRWHMTLTGWVRDYVFQPVAALTRLPVVALLVAMLVIGLWHESSIYYVLWAIWQALGIFLSHVVPIKLPPRVAAIVGPIFVLAWLSAARPMVLAVLA
ncbi:MAG: hypothetical protein NXI27_12025 [Alphaproteobacteria bacterium]|nr:hypothetical protein [Alphaproteobacteria bacterium]